MTHTGHSKRTGRSGRPGRQNTGATMRRRLRREVPSTVGLLADEQDFTAMREYRTFTFDDHTAYLRQIEGLLKSLVSQGGQINIAHFDPEEFAEFCEETGLDPDTPGSRTRFTARIASCGAVVAYTGQSIDSLVPLLLDRAVRLATWEYATMLLAELGGCADCGQDAGRAGFERASDLLLALLGQAGPGTHHLVCSVPTAEGQLLAVLHTECPEGAPARFDSSEGAEFVTVLAVGIALESPGGVVLRTTGADAPDRVHGWRLHRGRLAPLTAAEVFNAYCTDADTGEPLSPESGVEYCAGFDVEPDETGTHEGDESGR
jgi:hypothetical protein